MPSQLEREFDTQIDRLFRSRIHKLKSAVWPAKGAAPMMTKKKVNHVIGRLQNVTRDAFLRTKGTKKILREDFDYKRQWHPKRGKGWGRAAKSQHFKNWYEKNITTKNCVYAFWQKKNCLYIGRTLNGKGRPTNHFQKYWFGKATRVDVFAFDRKRDVPRFECLLTHKYDPSYSRMKPSAKKYYSRCAVCDGTDSVKSELKTFFRLK
jgi:hypothetical protein